MKTKTKTFKAIPTRFNDEDLELIKKVAKDKKIDVSKLIRLAIEPYILNERIEKNGRVEAITSSEQVNNMLSDIIALRYELENKELYLKEAKAKINDMSLELFKHRTGESKKKTRKELLSNN